MNLKRCNNGHFYDGDKFQICPHCMGGGIENTSATMPYRDMGGGFDTSVTESLTVPVYPDVESGPGRKAEENVSLKDAVSKAVSVPIEPKDEEKTISIYKTQIGMDPVVGWLVCIEGKDFGGSFTLKSGRNFVGRAANMDIVLHGDSSISREKHAIILYEPKRREFIAQAGEARELFYLNEEVVLNPVKLKQYDILTIGNTRLMFFPCCGENFSWDQFKKDEKKEDEKN